MIYKDRWRDYSYNPSARVFFCTVCAVCFNFCFRSLLNTHLYCSNIDKQDRKNDEYCLVCETERAVLGKFSDKILREFGALLKCW